MPDQSVFDPAAVLPEDLSKLSDSEFRTVVNADLRRRRNPEGILQVTSSALRSPEHVRRWHAILTAMRASVEGQLAAKAADLGHDAEESEGYQRWRAATERFRSGLLEHIAVAEALLQSQQEEHRETVLLADLRRRVRRLERAIEAHRDAVQAVLEPDEVPDKYEIDLWKVLEDE